MKIHDSASLPVPGAKWIWLVLLSAFLAGAAQSQVVINEIVADNQTIAPLPNNPDYFPDYIELYNNSDASIDLGAGWRIGDSTTNYAFTANTVIPARGYLLVFCDSGGASAPAGIHTGFGLSSTEGDAVYLYLGLSITDSRTFGIQAPDLALSRVPDVTGDFQLAIPSPGETNVAVTLGDRFQLRVNEWVATNSAGPDKDWFEIYNPDSNAVSLAGIVFADRGSSNLVQFLQPTRDYSYIAPFGFVQIFASDKNSDADEVDFSLSSSNGDDVWIFATTNLNSVIDHISFTGGQLRNTSEGRLPDGGPYTDDSGRNIQLKGTSPGDSNFGSIPEIVINELIAHVDPPLEDAIELYNPTATNVNIGGWWISNNRNNPKKYQIPAGTIVTAGEYKVFYEYQFNGSNPEPFNLNSAHGGELYLFKANASGDLLGFRRGVTFEASQNGISFGRWVNSQTNADIVPMASLSFGSAITRDSLDTPNNRATFRNGKGALNRYPKVGPIIINEIHFHPPGIIDNGTTNDNSIDEFIELHNLSNQAVPLFDPINYFYQGNNFADGRTNTYRIRGGISFDFPMNITMAANSFLLVVNFDPSIAGDLNDFTNRFGIRGYPTTVQIVGPYKGKLSNGGATVELRRPDPPQGPPLHADETGFVPYTYADSIRYNDKVPWPLTADGQGDSLQRRVSIDYGNEPGNWKGANPTAGRANSTGSPSAPIVTADPVSQAVVSGTTASLTVVASGSELSYRWQFNGVQLTGATNATLTLENISTNMTGLYRAVVINPGGIDFSATATLNVVQNVSDTTIPTVAVTTPANNARLTDPVVTVNGVARDNLGVAYVELQLNGGEFIPVSGSAIWSQEITLAPGPNVINVRSTDVATNHSTTVSRMFTYVVMDTINLTTNGQGSVSGATSSKSIEVGKTFTLTAKPAAGYVFSNWTGDISSVSPSLTFTMSQDLDLAANFVPNPFVPVAGVYNGLFHEESGASPQSAGSFSFKLTSKGTYTAQILLAGKKYSTKGVLDLVGHATNNIIRTGLTPLGVEWQVALDGSDTISGTISDVGWTSALNGDRAVYSALNPSPFAGRYTFVVPGVAPEAPEGTSYASVQVTTSGQAIIAGSLAENIKFTQKTFVSRNGEIPLYLAPYLGAGLFTGWADLEGSPIATLSGNVTWIKPSTAGGVFYPAGFTNDAALAGGTYVAPTSTTRILNLVDGQITLTGGNLGTPLTNLFGLAPGSGTVTNKGPHKLTLKFVPTTGLFSGTLTPTNTTTVLKFNGAVLTLSTNGAGYSAGSNRTARVVIEAR